MSNKLDHQTIVEERSVKVGLSQIKSVKTDNMKREIVISISFPLNADNFQAANKLAFFAFNDDPIAVTIDAIQSLIAGMFDAVKKDDSA